jgi:Ca-activated chloride channel homolog
MSAQLTRDVPTAERRWAIRLRKASRLIRRRAGFFLIGLTTLAVRPLAHLRAQNAPLRVNVKLVNVFVSVTDRNGAPVGGLSRDDFLITEDNRPQQIAIFERRAEMPLNLTLAIDTSDSVAKDLTLEQHAAQRFVQAILRPQDRMSLLEFASDVWELTPFTNSAKNIEQGITHLSSGGGTAFYDSIVFGSEKLGGQRTGRKVLVVDSDGDDTVKGADYPQALEQALRNEVMIYSLIDVPIEASAGRDLRGEHALITLAEETGGKSFYVSAGGLDTIFAQVSEDLRTQYFLAYYPRNQEPGTNFHRIRVTLPKATTDSYELRYRTGYYADSPIQ